MFGLAYLVAFGVYLLISVGVVKWAIGYAQKNGKSAKRWGWGAAFVMYSIVFWDWLPTVAVHQYYCAKDSGFWVYKTLDQWKAENPGVLETLVTQRNWPHQQVDGKDVALINQRMNLVYAEKKELFLNRWLDERELVDTKNGDVLARYIGFSTRDEAWDRLRFWLNNQNCFGGENRITRFGNFYLQFKGSEK